MIMPNVYIKGNENSIKQLIVILVDNAFKYSEDNGRIKVSVTDEQD
jgi:signal transduction histidine kinase